MWWILLHLLFIGGGGHIRARPIEEYTDTLKGYYHDYRLMDERELRGELTLVWFTIAGGAYYNLREQVSADCSNASVAAAILWQELPTLEESTPLIAAALRDAVVDIRTAILGRAPFRHPMEVICKRLELRLRTDVALYARFAHLKQTVKVDPRYGAPAAAASSHQEVANTSSLDHVNAFYVFWLQMPRIGQIVAHATFANRLEANCSTEYPLTKAIVELAKREQLRAMVQSLYEKVRQDVIQSVIDRVVKGEQDGHRVSVFRLVNDSIMAKLQQEFGAHPKIGTQLEKMIKQAENSYCKPAD